MKTLKQFVEETGYLKVKSPDEQKFVNKHTKETKADRAGNNDDIFKAANVSKVDRKKDRKGYEPGEDEDVYEEVEQVDELSKELTRRYFNKALDSGVRAASRQWRPGSASDANAAAAVAKKRAKGLGMAKDRLAKEEVEELDELSQDTVKKYKKAAVRDFYDADDVDDGRRLRQRYKGIKLANRRLAKEEVEQIDEVGDTPRGKKVLGDYAKKASWQVMNKGVTGGLQLSRGQHIGDSEEEKRGKEKIDTAAKRTTGVRRAITRLAKEEAELEEKKLTPAEMKKREEVAKAIERENPKMPMAKKMAIATATAKKVAEDFEVAISNLPSLTQEMLEGVFVRLNEDNKSKFLAACQTEEGLEKMVAFAIENRGE